ncbi:GNAT family N-acetyltransferase [Microbacterium azadirachtae]|nr:GNAT family N-acetyltransferase [Microbacterium azadirachtae]
MPTFRIASPEDADAHAVLVDYFTLRAAEFPGGGYSPTYPTAAAFQAPDGVFLLLEDEGAIVGCGGIRRVGMPDGETDVFEIKHVFLRPETRGRGWGRLLLDELERRARGFGAGALVLDTHHTLEAAGHLYRNSGFAEIPRYNDNPNASRWYRKELHQVNATVTMRSPQEGGRRAPAFLDGRFRPHVRVSGDDEYLGVIFLGATEGKLHPGEPAPIILQLIYDVDNYSKLEPGTEFDVLEGLRIVGRGVVT